MPSSYSASARYTLQATGENNNTWGVILNQGVFQLVDDNINGKLSFDLSGTKTLTTALGAPDEARMAFLDVTGGSGGTIVIPPVPKGYFLRNNAAGEVTISAGLTSSGVFQAGDNGPVFCDGATVYGITLGYAPLRLYIDNKDQQIINYINAAITSGSLDLPPATGNLGRALIVRNVGAPPVENWIPDFIQQADVVGLVAALAPVANLNSVIARALYGDLV